MNTAYADDTAFFLKDKESVKKVMDVFDTLSIYFGLKRNKSQGEIAGIGVLKRVSMELCGMECTDLTKNSAKLLGIHFHYNKKMENEENFIKLIIIHLALVTDVPHAIKIRHSSICNTCENGGLKSVDITNKLMRLQCSGIKRVYDTTTRCWKIKPAFLRKKN